MKTSSVILSDTILMHRQKIEKQLLSKFKMSNLDLAEYFDAPVKSINADLKEIGNIKSKNLPFNIDRQISLRNKKLNVALNRASLPFKPILLAQEGLWHVPKDYTQLRNKTLLKYLHNELDIKAVALIETGYEYTEAYKQVGGVSATSRTIIENYFKNNNIKAGHRAVEQDNEVSKFTMSQLDKAIKNNAHNEKLPFTKLIQSPTIAHIQRITGVPINNIKSYVSNPDKKKGLYNNDKYVYEEKDDIHGNKDKIALKWEIYNTWTAGKATQQELADKYKCTRATIMNYCDYCKSVTLDDQLKNIPTVRRRISSAETRTRVAERDTIIIAAFHEAGDSAAKACKLLGITDARGGEVTKVYNTLRKHGLIASKYERSQLETLESASVESERVQSLNVNAIFGYGPNQGKTKEGRKVYAKVHENQVATNYELKRSPEFRQHVNESAGEMTDYFIPKNTRARNEYVKKYPTSKIATEEKAKALVRKKGSPTTEINEPEI